MQHTALHILRLNTCFVNDESSNLWFWPMLNNIHGHWLSCQKPTNDIGFYYPIEFGNTSCESLAES